MKLAKIEKFGLKAIADAVKCSGVPSVRADLSQLVGAAAVCLSDCRLTK
jgi:hypothetical protein